MKRALLGLAVASLVCGCVDLEGAYEGCFVAGRCANPTNDAGVDAGLADAGFDVRPYDGGPPCSAGSPPRLECDAPLELLAGGLGITGATLAALPDGFLAGWSSSATVEARHVRLDAGVSNLFSRPGAADSNLVVAAHGAGWAMAWFASSPTRLQCLTSESVDVTVSMPDGGSIAPLGIARSAAGGVALALERGGAFVGGHAPSGCPSSLAVLPFADSANAAAVVATAAPGGEGFRYVQSEQLNAGTGGVTVATLEADGGLLERYTLAQRAPQQLAAVTSSDGGRVLVSYYEGEAPLAGLGVLGAPASLATAGQSVTSTLPVPRWWSMTSVRPGEVAVGTLTGRATDPVRIGFFRDTGAPTQLATWDVQCTQPTDGTLAVAVVGDRLGVLMTRPNAVEFTSCRLPP